MHISHLKQSKFLTRQDVGRGQLVTIKEIFEENVAKEGAPQEIRWCMEFEECDKPMTLNSTNGKVIAAIIGSEETDDWIGHKVVIYDDPNVSFRGELVGGIRVRAPKPQTAAAAPQRTAPAYGRTSPAPARTAPPQRAGKREDPFEDPAAQADNDGGV